MTRLYIRILKSGSEIDFVYLAVLSGGLVIVASAIGADQTYQLGTFEFTGLFDRWNWQQFPITLPLALYLLRYFSDQAFCLPGSLHSIRGNCDVHPLVDRISSEDDHLREALQNEIWRSAADVKNFYAALILSIVITGIDTFELAVLYYSAFAEIHLVPGDIREKDWTVMFAIHNITGISTTENMVLVLYAYFVQLCLIFLGLLYAILTFRFSNLYIRSIYRRTVEERTSHTRGKRSDRNDVTRGVVVLDFRDPAGRFGLIKLDNVFNTQVFLLIAAGAMLLLSRWSNADHEQITRFYDAAGNVESLSDAIQKSVDAFLALGILIRTHDVGQVMIQIIFIICVLVVLRPATIKHLPILNSHLRKGGPSKYLQEFIPPSDRDFGQELDYTKTRELAENFRYNEFWPAGSVLAWTLVFILMMSISTILFPLGFVLEFWRVFFVYAVFIFSVSIASTFALWLGFRFSLKRVGDILA